MQANDDVKIPVEAVRRSLDTHLVDKTKRKRQSSDSRERSGKKRKTQEQQEENGKKKFY